MKDGNPKKPKPIRAEVTDHVISLHMGENKYQSFFKGAIVEIEPVAFRNLEKKGRVKAAGSSALGFKPKTAVGVSPVDIAPKRKRKTKVVLPEEKTAPPEGDAV